MRRLSLEDRLALYKALAGLLKHKTALPNAIEQIQNVYKTSGRRYNRLVEVLEIIKNRLAKGGFTGDKLYRGIVPQGDNIIIIGTAGVQNKEHIGLERAMEMTKLLHDARNEAFQTLIIPTLAFITMIVAFWAIGAYAFPFLETLKPRTGWPPFPNQIYDISLSMASWLPFIGTGFLLIITSVVVSINRWTGETREWFDIHVPPYSITRRMYAAIIAASVGSLIEGGVDAITGIKRIESLTYSRWLKERTSRMIRKLTKGASLGQALNNPLFSPNTRALFEIFSGSANSEISKVLNAAAEDEIKSIKPALTRATKSIQFISYLGIGFLILVYLQAFIQITQQISRI